MKSEMSRRDFLKLGGAVGVTAAAVSVLGGGIKASAASEAPVIKEVLGNVSGANIVVYDPGTRDPRSKICIVMMYGSSRSTDTLPNAGMRRYAALGYRAANCAPTNGLFIDQVRYLSSCITWIKNNIEGIEKIVLWGNSRGCNLTSAYQRIAENGASTFQGAGMFLDIPNMNLVPADGIIMCDANYGFMTNHMVSLGTNLVSDDSVMQRTSELDPMNTANGYISGGRAEYPEEFRVKYWKAQALRYNRMLDRAQERMYMIKNGQGMFSDDEPFCVVMGFGNVNNYQLYAHDMSFFSHTKNPRKLLHNDGSITTEIVNSLRTPDNPVANFEDMARCYSTTVSEYLYCGMHIDVDNFRYDETEMFGIDIEYNFTSAHGNAKYISCPTIATGRTDGFEYIVAEWVYDRSIAAKKDCIFVEGMSHGGGASGQYANQVTNELSYIDNWLQEVFEFTGGVVEPPPITVETDAEFLQNRATSILNNGLSQDNLILEGSVLKLAIDGREFILSTTANNRNIDGEIAIGDGYYLVFDIKGNGSNIKEFKVIKK